MRRQTARSDAEEIRSGGGYNCLVDQVPVRRPRQGRFEADLGPAPGDGAVKEG